MQVRHPKINTPRPTVPAGPHHVSLPSRTGVPLAPVNAPTSTEEIGTAIAAIRDGLARIYAAAAGGRS